MTFNEMNSVEHFFIERLTGVNLNRIEPGNVVREPEYEDLFSRAYEYIKEYN